jgi:hypothetical protein
MKSWRPDHIVGLSASCVRNCEIPKSTNMQVICKLKKFLVFSATEGKMKDRAHFRMGLGAVECPFTMSEPNTRKQVSKMIRRMIKNTRPHVFDALMHEYNTLGNIELYHKNLSMCVADSMCMLQDVSKCFTFLLDRFGCDRWPSDVNSIGCTPPVSVKSDNPDDGKISSDEQPDDCKPSVNIVECISIKKEKAKACMGSLVRRNPLICQKIHVKQVGVESEETFIPDLDEDAYINDTAVIIEAIRTVLYTDNPVEFEKCDNEKNVSEYYHTILYLHCQQRWHTLFENGIKKIVSPCHIRDGTL